MPKSIREEDRLVVQRFGGGVNSRASEDEINERESAFGGENYRLDPLNKNFRPRRPFDLLDTAPNAAEIRGMVNLVKSDGTVAIAVQAGDTVYEYLGASSGFSASSIATVSSTARLRGRIEHNWPLTDKVLVTDLNLQEDVIEWDGTTWQDVTFSPSGQTLRAKYCVVAEERAWFANVNTGTATPHVFVASELSDYTSIDVANRPSSSLGAADPFFIVAPDLRPINGFIQEFGNTFFSTEDGRLYNLTGNDATNYQVNDFYPRSYASGDEAMIGIGNVVLYGRRGRIEMAVDTDRFADSEANDLSIQIADTIEEYKNWTSVYNTRTQKAYFFPEGVEECWVCDLTVAPTGLSPWVKFTSKNTFRFNPTCVMNMIDPDDGLEYIYMGDASGNFYKMEGTLNQGDAGVTDIVTNFVSRVYTLNPDMQSYDFTGYLRYKKNEAITANVIIRFAGKTAFDITKSITIPAADVDAYYNDGEYYGGGVYYGKSFTGRLLRQDFSVEGSGEDFQIQVQVESSKDFQINEVGLRFDASNI